MLRRKTGGRIMAATFGLACILAAGTSQARVALNGIGVLCYNQNELGQDEIYLKFSGVRVNMGSFSNGVQRTVSTSLIFASLPISVELWEDDGDHWYDRDDLWASTSVGGYGKTELQSSTATTNPQYHSYGYWFTLTNIP
jgi:hypothetical protein